MMLYVVIHYLTTLWVLRKDGELDREATLNHCFKDVQGVFLEPISHRGAMPHNAPCLAKKT